MPPLQALAALHGFWLVVASAALVLLLHRLSPGQLRLLGSALTVAGVLGLVGWITWDLARWLGTVPPDFHRYAGQRILFAIATNPDIPLVQVTAAGAVCWIVGKRWEKTRTTNLANQPTPAGSSRLRSGG